MIDYEKLKLAHELISKMRLAKLQTRYSKHDCEEYSFFHLSLKRMVFIHTALMTLSPNCNHSPSLSEI